MIHQKQNRVQRKSTIVCSRQVIAMTVRPIIVHFITSIARARCMTWCVNFRVQYGCAETISANVLNEQTKQ